MINLHPKQIKVLQKILTFTELCAVRLRIPVERINLFRENAYRFIRETHQQIGDKPYFLFLCGSQQYTQLMDLPLLLQHINSGRPAIYLDEGLHFSHADSGELRSTLACQQLSNSSGMIGLKVHGSYVEEWMAGAIHKEEDVVNTHSPAPGRMRFRRPMSQFYDILEDHMREVVDPEGVRYWKNRNTRLLLHGPDGTEKIFHGSLYLWLDLMVDDKLKVIAQPRGFGQNDCDILVITVSGNHLIEVKWMGKNENGTHCGEEKIDEGLIQVKYYLDRDIDCHRGHVIVYDGRAKAIHETECKYNTDNMHERCECPRILFLQSETPSVAAKRIVRGQRR